MARRCLSQAFLVVSLFQSDSPTALAERGMAPDLHEHSSLTPIVLYFVTQMSRPDYTEGAGHWFCVHVFLCMSMLHILHNTHVTKTQQYYSSLTCLL